jgi:hypothetical protein
MKHPQHLIRPLVQWYMCKSTLWMLIVLVIGLRFSTRHYEAIPSQGFALDSITGSGLYTLEEDGGQRFRWTDGDFRGTLPGDHASGLLHLRMYFPASSGPAATVGLSGYTATLKPSPEIRALAMFIPADRLPQGPAILSVQSGTSQAPGDQRRLGISLMGLGWRSFDQATIVSAAEWIIIGLIGLRMLALLVSRWRLTASALMEMVKGIFAVENADPRPAFRLAVLISLLVQMPIYSGVTGAMSSYVSAFYFMAMALIFVAVSLRGRMASATLLAGVIIMGVELRVYWTNRPSTSDVYWANMQAVSLFLEGRNPYSAIFTWVTSHPRYAWYGYLPWTIISQLPFYVLGNVRWGLAVFDLASIGLLCLMARRSLGQDRAAALAAGLLLYAPLSEYTLTNGIVDPIMLFWMIASIYLLSCSRWRWAALAAGLAIASKQYGAVYGIALLPYLIKHKQWGAITLLIGVPGLIVAPYAIWSFKDFLYDTLVLHMSFPPLPEPFTGVWNTSLPAQWVGLTHQNSASSQQIVKAVARNVTLLCVAVISIRNLFKPTLRQVIGTTVALLAVLFLWNGSLTQSFYWRNIVLLIAAWISCGPSAQPMARQAFTKRQREQLSR